MQTYQESGREIPMIVGLGKAVGNRTITNEDIDLLRGTRQGLTARMIRSSGVGIETRNWADDTQSVSGMMIEALGEALEDAKIKPDALSAVFLATQSPPRHDGSIAGMVQSGAGLRTDIPISTNADACSGFIYVAHRAITTMTSPYGSIDRGPVAIVSSELLSRNLSPKKNDTILFADGGGAVIFDWRTPKDGQADTIAFAFGADGGKDNILANSIRMPAGGTDLPSSHQTLDDDQHSLELDGKIVSEYASNLMPLRVKEALEKAGLTTEDINAFVFHQANKKIISEAAEKGEIPMEKVEITIDRYGNTSAGSIPITLYEADRAGRLVEGEYFAAAAFGGGFNSGAMIAPNPVRSF